MYTVNPIGIVHCPVTEMSQGNWRDVESEIRLDPTYVPGLAGLAEFSHIMVVFWLHQAMGFDPAKQLLRKPRGMDNLAAVGVFAQRTKYRPNPIAVSSVPLKEIRGGTIVLTGLDALDGTPVLDIKPYIPPFDSHPGATNPDWVKYFMDGYF